MEGTSGSRTVGCVDAHRSARAQATGIGPLTRFLPAPARGVRGFDPAERLLADKAAVLLTPPALRRERGSRSVPKPVSSRQARGRWRPDDREVVRRRPCDERWQRRVPGASSKPRAGGFPTAPGGQSPKVVFPGVLVTRNVGCRNGFEASWRCARGKPQGLTRRNVERRRRPLTRTGSMVVPLAGRVHRACKGRKAGAGPPGNGAQQFR